MAGIGFRLQTLIAKGSYLEATSAYLSSAVLSAGPWLAGVVALFVLNNTSLSYLPAADHALLNATIIWVFAFSLLLAGGPQMVITRYLADRLYLKDVESLTPTCTGILLLVLPLSILAIPFLVFAPFELRYRLIVFTLFLVLTLTWLVMLFLSAAHEHMQILLTFLLSYGISIGASVLLGHSYGLLGSIAGFTCGQVLCLTLLVTIVYREFPSSRTISLEYLSYFRRYWDLALIGLLYTLCVWADSLLFWFSSQGQVVAGIFHLYTPLDTAKFLMYLSTIPASAVFMVHLETEFYRHYRHYYRFIREKGTLQELTEARQGMQKAVREGSAQILKVQGLLALFLVLIAPNLAHWAHLQEQWVPLLRMAFLSGVAQYFVFLSMLLLLYIDRRREAMLLIAVYLVSIIVCTLISLTLGSKFYGAGYLVASVLTALFGWFLMQNRLNKLEYLTFMLQPIE